jgi:hypothetical protein
VTLSSRSHTKKCFVRTWRCASIAAVCGAALSRPSLASAVALVLVNPHRQSGVAGSHNRYICGTKKFEVLWRNFDETSKELWKKLQSVLRSSSEKLFLLFSVLQNFFAQPCL